MAGNLLWRRLPLRPLTVGGVTPGARPPWRGVVYPVLLHAVGDCLPYILQPCTHYQGGPEGIATGDRERARPTVWFTPVTPALASV